jgi:hypothetical protein
MPTFETIAKYVAAGCLVKPLLVNFFTSGEAFKLTIHTAKPQPRAPDGWFHASTHPGLTEGQLITYLTMPKKEDPEDFGYLGRMSVLYGTIMHEVTRQALYQLGLMVPVREGTCPACGFPQPRHCREHGASQPETRSRGHLDGILCFEPRIYGQLPPGHRRDLDPEHIWGFDLKTIKNVLLAKAPDMDEAFFKERWPEYWWQVQEYMRLTGLRRYIVLFQGIGNPWDLREYHVMADPVAAYQIEAKYRSVLARVGLA